VAAWRAGHAAYQHALHAARIANHERVRVNAILEQDAVLAYSESDGSVLVQKPVPATWSDPDGRPRRGMVVPRSPAPAGTAVPVWMDMRGNLTAPPPTEGDVQWAGIRTGLLVFLGVFGACGCARMLMRRLVDRRRMAWWQSEWTSVGPRWTGRR
jgi:hypothetical protein